MKKVLLAIICFVMLAQVNAASISNANKNSVAKNNNTSANNYFRMSMAVVTYDNCGNKLSFTVSCSSCSWSDLGSAADNFIFNHTNANGCYFI